MIWKIWLLVPVFYGLFAYWYYNWSGPISASEVEQYMQAFNANEGSKNTDAAVFQKFLEQDDGKEIVMVNLIKLHSDKVAHPVSGELTAPNQLLVGYFGPFVKALLKRAGHPVHQARKVGGHIDSWNAHADEGFAVTAMMRYRSRKDLVELIIDPRFVDGHIYKLAAIEKTTSFPTQISMSTSLRPGLSVLLILLLLTSLAQNIVVYFR